MVVDGMLMIYVPTLDVVSVFWDVCDGVGGGGEGYREKSGLGWHSSALLFATVTCLKQGLWEVKFGARTRDHT